MTDLTDLTDFLSARIAEDHATARNVNRLAGLAWRYAPDPDAPVLLVAPARVLVECEAKRKIVAAAPGPHNSDYDAGYDDCIGFVLKCLALPYADHADYRAEWRP